MAPLGTTWRVCVGSVAGLLRICCGSLLRKLLIINNVSVCRVNTPPPAESAGSSSVGTPQIAQPPPKADLRPSSGGVRQNSSSRSQPVGKSVALLEIDL